MTYFTGQKQWHAIYKGLETGVANSWTNIISYPSNNLLGYYTVLDKSVLAFRRRL